MDDVTLLPCSTKFNNLDELDSKFEDTLALKLFEKTFGHVQATLMWLSVRKLCGEYNVALCDKSGGQVKRRRYNTVSMATGVKKDENASSQSTRQHCNQWSFILGCLSPLPLISRDGFVVILTKTALLFHKRHLLAQSLFANTVCQIPLTQ